jgi:hypothetical protein
MHEANSAEIQRTTVVPVDLKIFNIIIISVLKLYVNIKSKVSQAGLHKIVHAGIEGIACGSHYFGIERSFAINHG